MGYFDKEEREKQIQREAQYELNEEIRKVLDKVKLLPANCFNVGEILFIAKMDKFNFYKNNTEENLSILRSLVQKGSER